MLDLTEAEFGIEEESWEQILGYRCNFCAAIGRTGYRKVEVLKRLLGDDIAEKVILPDDVCRRHINVIMRNPGIHLVEVRPSCKLFSMKGNAIMNKRRTKVIYNPTTQPSPDKDCPYEQICRDVPLARIAFNATHQKHVTTLLALR